MACDAHKVLDDSTLTGARALADLAQAEAGWPPPANATDPDQWQARQRAAAERIARHAEHLEAGDPRGRFLIAEHAAALDTATDPFADVPTAAERRAAVRSFGRVVHAMAAEQHDIDIAASVALLRPPALLALVFDDGRPRTRHRPVRCIRPPGMERPAAFPRRSTAPPCRLTAGHRRAVAHH